MTPAQRRATIEKILEAGLDWYNSCEPIGPEHTARELAGKLRQAGFEPERISYANMLLFPIAALKRMTERCMPVKQTGSDLTIGTGVLNTPMRWILSLEAPLVARTGLPFGLTAVALARRR